MIYSIWQTVRPRQTLKVVVDFWVIGIGKFFYKVRLISTGGLVYLILKLKLCRMEPRGVTIGMVFLTFLAK